MPEIPGLAIVALVVVVALVIYGIAWRLTRGRSLVTRTLVRGGLALLILAPIALAALIPSYKSYAPIDEELDAGAPPPASMSKEEARDRVRALEERSRKAAQREQSASPGVLQKLEAERQAARERMETEVEGDLKTARKRSYQPESTTAKRPPPAPPAAGGNSSPPGTGEMTDDAARAPEGRTEVAPMRVEEEKSDWDIVPVFFGTDRAEEPNPKRLAFNSDRGRRLEIGRALVTVPKSHEVPQIERPWSIKIPYFDVTIYEEEEDPKRHFTMPEIQKLSKPEFLRLARERLAASVRFKDHAIVFVHGYNTSFDNAVYRTAQISYDLKFDGAAFLYSWPSGGAVASYTYDRESATAAKPYMREFLELVIKQSGAKSISIIAHSMGNQPLMEVLKDMRSSAPDDVVISQIILAAPDVDADTFTNLAREISGFAKGVTLYAAANDRALTISRNFWQNPRAGDVPASGPVIVPGVDTIDVTGASTDVFALNHSGYAQNTEVLDDIGRLILNGLRPPDQRFDRLKPVVNDRGEYWRYSAQP